MRELLQRRIPHVLGLYLAAGWGLLEFSDWVERRSHTAFPLADAVLIAWLLAMPIVLYLAWRFGLGRDATADREDTPTSITSVAVLPFANLSDSPDREYLSDGITEEVINALARVDGLRVVSRTSVFAYKRRNEDVRTIGRELNVGSVLEGSVQLVGERLRITTQLVDVTGGFHLWSERYDRQLKDVFAIEDEIADSVVRALRVILKEGRSAPSRVPRANVKAYEYYLRGRQFFHQTRKKSLEFAREMFERAIEIDPDYALAFAGVANTSALIHMYYPGSQEDLERADRASRRALELDPELAEAHAARGFALMVLKRGEDAEREFKRAIELDPKLFEAWYFYARSCFQEGRFAEAATLFEEASRVREDYQSAFFAAQSHEALGNETAAQAAYRRALAVVEQHMDLNPDDPRAATMRAVSHCRIGAKQEGLVWAERALAIDPEDAGVRYNVACLYALEGEAEKAITCLEQAMAAGFGNREWIKRDPDLESLRENPRFRALLEDR